MLTMNNIISANTQRNFLIGVFSYSDIDLAVRRYARAAMTAYTWRVLKDVGKAGEFLMSSSQPVYAAIGAYFKGLAVQRGGSGDLEAAQRLFEIAARIAPAPICQRAILAQAAIATYKKDRQARLMLLNAALTHAQGDAFTFFEATRGLAILQSELGNHLGAITILESVEPYLKHADLYLVCEHRNSLAVELSMMGQSTSAMRLAALPASSLFVPAYPEWVETKASIERDVKAKEQMGSRVVMFPSKTTPDMEIRQEVINLLYLMPNRWTHDGLTRVRNVARDEANRVAIDI